MTTQFPADFLWGAATASYQIEGAVAEDGRQPSIWDTFSHTPGKIHNGDTGDVADDHYHLWRDDIALMHSLGLRAYRLSVAWPRILPNGTGAVNAPGLDFYDRLVDGLLAAGIRPFVTLYHWDLPQTLQDAGGWANRATMDAFVHYADIVARRLGDRVHDWITHNEPWCISFLSHMLGHHAPGATDAALAFQVAHHVLTSHGLAVPVIRAAAPRAQVGITLNLFAVRPESDSEADAAAARRHDGYLNRWFLDPVFGRGYPNDILDLIGPLAPTMQPGDLQAAGVPTDFLGINYYNPSYVRASDSAGNLFKVSELTPQEYAARGFQLTEMGWPIDPTGLRDVLLRVHLNYGPRAIYITENGIATPDTVVDGRVDDPGRIAYIDGHLRATADAMRLGAPVRGYFLWSLMDNFEWAWGYSKRFGAVYVDYATQRRIAKASAHWYKGVITANSLD